MAGVGKVEDSNRKHWTLPVGISRFIFWWKSELESLAPARLKQLLAADPFLYVIRVKDDFVQVFRSSQQNVFSLPTLTLAFEGDWNGARNLLRRCKRKYGPLLSVSLQIPNEHCFFRQNTIPKSALQHASSLMLLDIERISPFKRSDIYVGWINDGSKSSGIGSESVTQVVVKRSRIDPALRHLQSVAIAPKRVDVFNEDGSVLHFNIQTEQPGRVRLSIWSILAALSMIVGILFLTVVSLSLYRQEQAIAQLSNATAQIRDRAVQLRKEAAALSKSNFKIIAPRMRRSTSTKFLDLWEELSRLTPDDAWLVDLAVNGNKIRLSGFAKSAANLISIYEKSDLFSDVSFASPVTVDRANGRERFLIAVRLNSYSLRAPKGAQEVDPQ